MNKCSLQQQQTSDQNTAEVALGWIRVLFHTTKHTILLKYKIIYIMHYTKLNGKTKQNNNSTVFLLIETFNEFDSCRPESLQYEAAPGPLDPAVELPFSLVC